MSLPFTGATVILFKNGTASTIGFAQRVRFSLSRTAVSYSDLSYAPHIKIAGEKDYTGTIERAWIDSTFIDEINNPTDSIVNAESTGNVWLYVAESGASPSRYIYFYGVLFTSVAVEARETDVVMATIDFTFMDYSASP